MSVIMHAASVGGTTLGLRIVTESECAGRDAALGLRDPRLSAARRIRAGKEPTGKATGKPMDLVKGRVP